MATRETSWLARPGFLRILMDVQLAARLLREPAVPMYLKALPFAAVVYVLSPLDFLPDFLPVFGQLDDLGICIVGLKMFLMLCPVALTAFHREALAQGQPFAPMSPGDDVIDAEFRRL